MVRSGLGDVAKKPPQVQRLKIRSVASVSDKYIDPVVDVAEFNHVVFVVRRCKQKQILTRPF